MKKAVIGILAHVDAGKTTLSEAMLFRTGQLRKLGRVDHQDSFLDQDVQERERGITIFSKQARMDLKDWEVTFLDTPGHVDFSSEMERTLKVLDYAILVISGSDGVQSHTRTLWRLLERYQIPAFIFVNKMDLSQRSRLELMNEFHDRLSDGFVDMGQAENIIHESIAEVDESAMEAFFAEGSVPEPMIRSLIRERKVFPCYFGSALKVTGVDELLAGMDQWMEEKIYSAEFGAMVYKIGRDAQGERLSFLKVTGGTLKVRDVVQGTTNGETWSQKVNQIRIYSGARFAPADEAPAGTIAAVTGLSETYAGQGLGSQKDAISPVLDSFLSYEVIPEEGEDIHKIHQQMTELEEEDPALHVVWNAEMKTLYVQLMGEVQLEVLERLMQDRFHASVTFGPGSIVYRETIESMVEGVGHYEPLRHYAEVHLLMEPAERGKGLTFRSMVREDILDKPYQHLILTHLAEKTHIGVLTGSPITDMIISIIGGAGSVKHTVGGDFRESTYRAIRQGLMEAKSILLEPWYDFELTIPSSCVGRAINDMDMLHATFEPPRMMGDEVSITGYAPAACLMGYQMNVSAYTKGEGMLVLMPRGYWPCHNADEVIAQKAYDPDEDVENSAGSIFCAHGAGFYVPWWQVPSYMHVETEYSYLHPKRSIAGAPRGGNAGQADRYDEGLWDTDDLNASPASSKKTRAKGEAPSSLEMDKELMAIFERTYGKIKEKDIQPVKKTPKKEPEKTPEPGQKERRKPPKEIKDKTEYLLVDGYNIVYAFDSLKELAKDNIDLARTRLMDMMSAFQTLKGCVLILVFDAYNVQREKEDVVKYHNIYVVYTKQAETADTYIERATYELLPNHIVKVATSDGAEQMIVLGHGALRISAREFEDEIKEVQEQMDRLISDWNRKEKRTLTQKININNKNQEQN